MAVSGVRAHLAQVLAAAVPAGAVVRPYPLALDAVEQLTILVGVVSVDPPGIACPSDAVACEVLAVSPFREPGTADDDLDAILDLLHPALDTLPNVTRGTTERFTYLDTWPAYRIPLEYVT